MQYGFVADIVKVRTQPYFPAPSPFHFPARMIIGCESGHCCLDLSWSSWEICFPETGSGASGPPFFSEGSRDDWRDGGHLKATKEKPCQFQTRPPWAAETLYSDFCHQQPRQSYLLSVLCNVHRRKMRKYRKKKLKGGEDYQYPIVQK